jgi:hypothetical protein
VTDYLERVSCGRCGRPGTIHDPGYIDWETVGDAEVCPDCLTEAEEQDLMGDDSIVTDAGDLMTDVETAIAQLERAFSKPESD